MSLSTLIKGIPEAYYVWIFKKPLAKFLLRGCERKEGRKEGEKEGRRPSSERVSFDLKAGKHKVPLQNGKGQ